MASTQYDRERIERLREKAVSPTICFYDYLIPFYKRYLENGHLLHVELRYADAFRHACMTAEPSVGEGELIVGKADRSPSPDEEEEFRRLAENTVHPLLANCGQDSHRAVNYELLLSKGVRGVLADIAQRRRALDVTRQDGLRQDIFYQSAQTALEAVVILSGRYADKAEAQANACADETQAAEWRQIAAICRRVPEYPAESFHEAVQSVHFLTFCLSVDPFRPFSRQQFQLGHPDDYLYPFYLWDKRENRLTDARAQTLLDCLGIQINHRVPNGLSSGYMVGGLDRSGRPVYNELTEMGLRAVEQIRLVYPAVGLCWREDAPESYLKAACDILSQGYSHPAIFNDRLITRGLAGYGVPEDEARRYIHSTCVEITPVASSNVWVASPYMNLAQLLLDILGPEYACMDELLAAYFARLAGCIRDNLVHQLSQLIARANRGVNPLLSSFTDGCLERGLDVERGGAKYNWIMPSFVGMANLVDSLFVIREMIFGRKTATFAGLKHMLDTNFEGCEAKRLEYLNTVEKYGNDADAVDEYAALITDRISRECAQYTFHEPDGKLIPSVFCWIMHDVMGQETGATPDGRPAGFPLGDGSGPAQGRERKGPTASVLSSTKWNHEPFIGGVAVNMKFSKKLFTAGSGDAMAALIKTYMMRGGFEIQINVTDRDTLLKARENPGQYRDLIVRIGGYSDYFVRLSPTMQEEVLIRTEHEL